MALRIEKDFTILDLHGGRPPEIVHGQLVKVLLLPQHLQPGKVIPEERRRAAVDIVWGQDRIVSRLHHLEAVEFLPRVVAVDGHFVSLGQLPPQFRRQGPFEVDVKFDLGDLADERVIGVGDFMVPLV